MEIYQSALDLYGLIHCRYILTSRGLHKMKNKFLNKSAASGKAVTASTATDVVYAIALEAAAAASDVIKVQVGYAGVITE